MNSSIYKEMDTKKTLKTFYICECCTFEECRQKCYINFINKHKKRLQEDTEKTLKKYICICGNEYLYPQGLSKHKKKCKILEPDTRCPLIDNNKQLQYKRIEAATI
jgi:hypothetical protein